MARIFFKKEEQRASIFISLALAAAILSALSLIIAGPLYTVRLYGDGLNSFSDLNLRMQFIGLAIVFNFFGLLLWGIGLVHGRTSRRARVSWRGWVSAILLLGISLPMAMAAVKSQTAPMIHDVTSNLDMPPQFDLIGERLYPRSVSGGPQDQNYRALHQSGYSGLTSQNFERSRAKVEAAVRAALTDLNWQIEPASGPIHIEAYKALPFFGFRTNMVIQLVAENGGMRVDVRSVLTVGVSDLGLNANQIRRFQNLLAEKLSSAP